VVQVLDKHIVSALSAFWHCPIRRNGWTQDEPKINSFAAPRDQGLILAAFKEIRL
jgi:hypothetical protein